MSVEAIIWKNSFIFMGDTGHNTYACGIPSLFLDKLFNPEFLSKAYGKVTDFMENNHCGLAH
jgi:hypothetical protein